MDLKGWRPNSGEPLFSKSISGMINGVSDAITADHGVDSALVSTRSLRAGCAAALYAAGVDPIDIQRCARWESSIYMRYIWHGNLRFRHLFAALTAPTQLAKHLKADLGFERNVFFR